MNDRFQSSSSFVAEFGRPFKVTPLVGGRQLLEDAKQRRNVEQGEREGERNKREEKKEKRGEKKR